MADISLLTDTVDNNIDNLIPPKEPIFGFEYKIVSTGITIRDNETLDLRIFINSKLRPHEYTSLEDYWADTKQVLQQSIHPGLKAKAALELRHAVAAYDRTITPEGFETVPRDKVLTSLQAIMDHYTSQPTETPRIYRYSGRNEPRANEFAVHMALESSFLCLNRDALNSMIFSNKEELKKIYAHKHKFPEGVMYSTELKNVRDG